MKHNLQFERILFELNRGNILFCQMMRIDLIFYFQLQKQLIKTLLVFIKNSLIVFQVFYYRLKDVKL